MKRLCKQNLHKVKPYVPGKPIEEVERELGIKNIIKMASNENPFGPSPEVVSAMSDAAKTINRYPDADCFYLKKALSEKHSVASDTIFIGNGSDEVFVLALKAFIHPGEEVLIADPTFLMYNIASVVEGAEVSSVPMKDMRYDLEAMAEAITDKTKMIFIANPDNPVGSYVTAKEMDKFIERVPGNVILIIDEAYFDFAEAVDFPQTIGLTARKDKNIIVTRTFSKAYGLAGLRIGYGIARRDIVEILNKVREPFNVNSIAQAAAVAALKGVEYVEKSISLVREEKKRFYKFFEELKLECIASSTNFILVNTGCDSKLIFNETLKRGIIIREMSVWRLDGFIRVTIGSKEENDRFFKVFKEVMNIVKA
jgi:histidinol-phosphate aminotransferase